MWHHFTLTVPADTAEADPVEQDLYVTHGVITYLGIPWDSGVNYMVKCRLYRFRHQIFPINSGESACGSGFLEGGKEHLKLLEPPFVLTALGYSPGTTYPHDVTILINILPLEIAEPWRIYLTARPRRIEWPVSV